MNSFAKEIWLDSVKDFKTMKFKNIITSVPSLFIIAVAVAIFAVWYQQQSNGCVNGYVIQLPDDYKKGDMGDWKKEWTYDVCNGGKVILRYESK